MTHTLFQNDGIRKQIWEIWKQIVRKKKEKEIKTIMTLRLAKRNLERDRKENLGHHVT